MAKFFVITGKDGKIVGAGPASALTSKDGPIAGRLTAGPGQTVHEIEWEGETSSPHKFKAALTSELKKLKKI
jgi:hypothetical protein